MISRCISLRSLYLRSQSQVKLFYQGTPEWYGPTPSSTFFSSTNCLFENSEFRHSLSEQGSSTCTFLWSNQISLGPCFSCTSANERIKWCPVTATVTFCEGEWQIYNFGLMQETLQLQASVPNWGKRTSSRLPEVLESLSITAHSKKDMSNFSAKVSKVNGFQIPVFQNQIKDKAFCILYLNLSGRLCRPSEAHIVHSGDADDVGKLHQL